LPASVDRFRELSARAWQLQDVLRTDNSGDILDRQTSRTVGAIQYKAHPLFGVPEPVRQSQELSGIAKRAQIAGQHNDLDIGHIERPKRSLVKEARSVSYDPLVSPRKCAHDGTHVLTAERLGQFWLRRAIQETYSTGVLHNHAAKRRRVKRVDVLYEIKD